MSTIEVATQWGVLPARYVYQKHPNASGSLVVLFPGRGYTIDAPVLWFSAKVMYEAGYDVVGVEYGFQANRTEFDVNQLHFLVEEASQALNPLMKEQYKDIVFIGKSLGTIVQTKILPKLNSPVDRHIFLTPLRPVIPFIRQLQDGLVFVGDSDNLFGPPDIAEISGLSNVKVTVVPGADHSLETEDSGASLDILKEITKSIRNFAETQFFREDLFPRWDLTFSIGAWGPGRVGRPPLVCDCYDEESRGGWLTGCRIWTARSIFGPLGWDASRSR